VKEKAFRANATDINKTPTEVRYIFILELKNSGRGNSIGVLMTYRTLGESLKLKPQSIRVADLKTNIISQLRFDQMENFLDEWRENYFDPDWAIPFQFFK
jgi:hypothetical protein